MTESSGYQASRRSEISIITCKGDLLAADARSVGNYKRWRCNDCPVVDANVFDAERSYGVMNPSDLVRMRTHIDVFDHIFWLPQIP